MAIERKTRNYGAFGAKVHIFKFDYVSEGLTPRLAVAAGQRRTLGYLMKNSIPSSSESVIAINGGFFENVSDVTQIRPLKDTYMNGIKKNTDGDSNYDGIGDIFYMPSWEPKLNMYNASTDEAKAASWFRAGGYNLVVDGKIATTGISASQYKERDKKTMIGLNGTKVIVAVAELPGLVGSEMSSLMLEEGAHHAIGLDGGGSTGCYFNSESVINSSRTITDAIIFTKPKSASNTGLYITANNLAIRIRSNPVDGNILYTVPKGESLKIRFFISGFQSDGYQWAATEYNGIPGYSQIDTKNCYTVTGYNPNLKLSTQVHGGYIRSSVVNGTILKEVPKNQTITILELLPGFQSDGYQWARTVFDGTPGYTQIDVKSWHFFVL